MSSRKRRASSRLQQDSEVIDLEQETIEDMLAEAPRKRRSASRSSPAAAAAAAAAAAGGDAAADNDIVVDDIVVEGDADAAAAAAAAGNGAGPSGQEEVPPRFRQTRTEFNPAEADEMMRKIKELEDEAELAQDRAADLNLAATALETAVSRVVRFLLFRHHEKPGVPVKRQDINDVISAAVHLPKGHKTSKKLPAVVLTLAAARLAKAFGLELRELKRLTPAEAAAAAAAGGAAAAAAAAAAGGGSGSGGAAAAAAGGGAAAAGTQTYKLLSMLPIDLMVRYARPAHEDQERGFVTVVLALLQLKQFRMDADELWRHLAQLGLNADDRDAELPFGKHPTKILESMEHSRYLVSRKEPAPNTECGTLTVYEWGEAAHNEFGQGLLDGVVDQFLKTDD